MRHSRPRIEMILLALLALAGALLACSLGDTLAPPQHAPTRPAPTEAPPTAAPTSAVPTAAATDLSPSPPPSPSPAASATPPPPTATTEPGPDISQPARDACGFPGLQANALFYSAGGANALLGPFSGNIQILKTPGGPNIFSMQDASVQRKFVIILPNLNPAQYDLGKVYMSYTEKKDANDHNPRVWKAATGELDVVQCPDGGLAVRTVEGATSSFMALASLFQPLAASSNTATGDIDIGFGAKIQ